MPLHWTIDSRLQIFVATCDGNVELAEVNEMIDAVVGAKGLGYRKLFDGTNGNTQMSAIEMLGIGVRLRALQHEGQDHGALAVVAPDDRYVMLSRLLGILAAARRPMRVFKDAGKARKWLDSPPIRASLPAFDDAVALPVRC
ncbi:MAG: hypothetical protein FD144_3625 [Rhodospirillaceae bacterium]|nr:MAG: hypothetical protein FD144_3625 [Rhodospirillaceae bacterium]